MECRREMVKARRGLYGSPIMGSVPNPLLLDLDGTLIDSEPWYKRTEVETLREFGVDITLDEMEEFTGLTLGVWLATLNARYDKALTKDEFLVDYRPRMEEHVAKNVDMFPDAVRLLERMDGRRAMLVTSSMKWYVDAVLDRYPSIRKAVMGIVCEADVALGKPEPEPYLKAAAALDMDPASCIVVEDAINGVKSGIAAGCNVIGIDRYSHGTLSMASSVVRSLDEIELE